jgi:L-alanine-DL-glutamate epimerase-like enolase superfamily enzyme
MPRTRIAAVEWFRLRSRSIKEAWTDDEYGWPSEVPCLLVKVTAEDGAYGVGEAASQPWYLGETAEQMDSFLRLYARALAGHDAANLALAHRLMEKAVGAGMPGGRSARAGVDMALHDLVGKARGVPVHALLGGALRRELPQLTNLYHKTPEAMAEACRRFARAGFKGLKVKVGDELMSEGWSRGTLLKETAKLEAALEAAPRDVMIDADANQGWANAGWTVATLARFKGRDNLSIEQPLGYADLAGAAFVRRHAGVPVILDESVWSPEAVLEIARQGAADRVVIKLNRLGGLFPSLQALTIAEAAGIGVSVDTNPFSLVGDTAGAHLAAVQRVPYPVDCEGHVSFLDFGTPNPFTGGVAFRDGLAVVPDAPGLGLDVDWELLKRKVSAA